MSRGAYDPATFSSLKVSPSRVNSLVQCGVAFERKYVQGVPEERSGSAALFGSVMHDAVERWALNRSTPLISLVRSAWLDVTEGTVLNDFIGAYGALSGEAIRLEHAIRQSWAAKGKESKAPRMTKEWKESDVYRKINRLLGQWWDKLDASPWKFAENDPITALYDESLVLGKRYEQRWKGLPAALYTELAFDVRWRHGFLLNGYIDAIEPVLDPDDGQLIAIAVVDYKTYRKEAVADKDRRQMTMYDVAVRAMIERGELDLPDVPIFICMDYMRLLDRKVAAVTTDAYDLLETELLAYQSIVDGGLYLPAEKNRNPDFCGYGAECCLRREVNRPVEIAW